MGDGTASSVQTPPQEGVITRDGENFPLIPKKLLKLSPDELQKRIERIGRSLEFNRNRFIPDWEAENRLEGHKVVLKFAKTAVERQIAARRGKER